MLEIASSVGEGTYTREGLRVRQCSVGPVSPYPTAPKRFLVPQASTNSSARRAARSARAIRAFGRSCPALAAPARPLSRLHTGLHATISYNLWPIDRTAVARLVEAGRVIVARGRRAPQEVHLVFECCTAAFECCTAAFECCTVAYLGGEMTRFHSGKTSAVIESIATVCDGNVKIGSR